jgi:pimeloyl-ACP methyl ester carboxylesterase
MKRSAIALTLCLVAISAAPTGAAPGDDIYARPALLAQTRDSVRLNLVCLGAGSPTVVFEAGFGDWAPVWAIVQPRVAQFTRACSYDRAGFGFSDPGPLPRTSERIATELHDALSASGTSGPYVLVGNASGGDHVRAFADLFASDVAGLVLLDGDASDVDTPANRRRDDQSGLDWVPDLKRCRAAIAAGDVSFALPSPPGRPSPTCGAMLFGSVPEANWSPELKAKLLDIAQHKVALWDAAISEMEQVAVDEDWLQEHRRFLGDRPVRILTSGNHGVGDLNQPPPVSLARLKYAYDTALAQSRWLSLSSDARQIFINHSSEYIEFDQPQAVVTAIKEVCDKARAKMAPAAH